MTSESQISWKLVFHHEMELRCLNYACSWIWGWEAHNLG